MAVYSLRKQVAQMRAELERLRAKPSPLLARLAADPAEILNAAGMSPDPWQAKLLRSSEKRVLMCATRQGGKSQTAAALALREALLRPGSLVLLFSPTLRQSSELFRAKVLHLYEALGRPVAARRESALAVELANGSRIISLPGNEANVRGYSAARLVIIDEASRVPDRLYLAVRPMLAVSGGSLVALSTPWGKVGWFYDAWHSATEWERVRITADQCPRISPEFLEEERRTMGARWFACEYMAEFVEAIDSVFSEADIKAAMDDALPPLF